MREYCFNIWCHITTVPACISGTLTNVLPHRDVMSQARTLYPTPSQLQYTYIGLTSCCAIHWNVTLERHNAIYK